MRPWCHFVLSRRNPTEAWSGRGLRGLMSRCCSQGMGDYRLHRFTSGSLPLSCWGCCELSSRAQQRSSVRSVGAKNYRNTRHVSTDVFRCPPITLPDQRVHIGADRAGQAFFCLWCFRIVSRRSSSAAPDKADATLKGVCSRRWRLNSYSGQSPIVL